MNTELPTVLTLYQEFVDCRPSRRGNASTHNRRNYETRLRRFLELYGHLPPAKVKRAHVDEWITEIDGRDYQEATLSGYRQALKALWNYAVAQGVVARSPAAHLRTGSFLPTREIKPRTPPVALATEQALVWLSSDDPRKLRDGCIFMLSRQSGPRRGEIRELRRRAVVAVLRDGPDEFGVYHVQTVGKTGPAIIRFNEILAQALRRWLAVRPDSPDDALFTTTRRPYHGLAIGGINQVWLRVCEAAGLNRTIRSHALRHYIGDETARRYGAKVAAMLLNHADANTAATAIAFYCHPGREEVSAAVAGMSGGEGELAEMRRLFGVP